MLSAVANDDFASVDLYEGSVDLNIFSNDYSTESGELALESIVSPEYGTVEYLDEFGEVTAVIGDATAIRYIADPAYLGTVQFAYTVSDGTASDTGLVSIQVTDYYSYQEEVDETVDEAVDDVMGTNDAPYPYEDYATVTAGELTTIDVLVNDYDPDGDELRVIAVGSAANGTVSLVPIVDSMIWDGWLANSSNYGSFEEYYDATWGDSSTLDYQVQYTANAQFTGGDSFTYTVADPSGATATGTVYVTVESSGSQSSTPTLVASNDSVNTDYETVVVIDVLANDSTSVSGGLTIVSVTNGYYGAATIQPQVDEYTWQEWVTNGTGYASFEDWYVNSWGGDASALAYAIEYTPAQGFSGQDVFTYTIQDAQGQQATATVYVNVAEHTVIDDIEEIVEEVTQTVEEGTEGTSGEGATSGSGGESSSGSGETGGTTEDPPTEGSGIEGEIGGNGGSSGSGESEGTGEAPPEEPTTQAPTTLTLESGIVIDPYVAFQLPVDQRTNSSTTTSGTDLISESLTENAVTFATVGQTDWTLTTTFVDNSDVWASIDISTYPPDYDFVTEFGVEWSYTEVYTAASSLTTTGTDNSTSGGTSTYGYTFTAWEVGDDVFYTLSMD